MGVDKGNLQIIDVDVILENCPITVVCVCVCFFFLPIHSGHQVRWTYQLGSRRRIVILNLLAYNSTIQYSNIDIIVHDDSKCHRTSSFRLPLTSLCDLPLLFVYFQVNNGVLYFLDYEDNLHHGPLCSRFNVVGNSFL